MNNDLAERLEFAADFHKQTGRHENAELFAEAAAAIRELEARADIDQSAYEELLRAKEAAEAEVAALREERDAARKAVNRLGRAMGVVPGVAQCFGDVIDEAIKRLSARTPADKGEG